MTNDRQERFGAELDSAIDRYFDDGVAGDINDYLDAQDIQHPALTVRKHEAEAVRPGIEGIIQCPEGYVPTNKVVRRRDGSDYTVFGCKYVGL